MDQNKKGSDVTKKESKPGGPDQNEKEKGLADDLDAVLQKQLNDKLKAGSGNGKSGHEAAAEKKADEKKEGSSPKIEEKKADEKKIDEKKADEKKAEAPVPVVPPKAEEKKGLAPAMPPSALSMAPKVEEKKAEVAAPVVPPKVEQKGAPPVTAAAALSLPPKAEAMKADAPAAVMPIKGEEKKGVPPVTALPAFTVPPKPEEKKAEAPAMPAFSMPPPKTEEKKAEAPAMPAFSMPPPKTEEKKAEAPAMPAFSMPPPKPEEKKAEAPAMPAFSMPPPKPEEKVAAPILATSPVPLAPPEPLKERLPPLSLAVEPAPDSRKEEKPASEPLVASQTEEADEPLPTPGKDAFVAAAEKERVLKLIRDAATKRLEDTPDPRAQKVASVPEPVEEPVAEPVTESTSGSTFAVTEDVVATTPAPTGVESAPAPVEESKPFGVLIPPSPRIPISSLHNKPELLSPSQVRLNEAFVRQLKGAPPLPDPAPRQSDATDPAPAKPKAVRRVASGRKMTEDGATEVPVESLGTGLYNALGDMVGGVVRASRSASGIVQAKIAPVDPAMETQTGPRLTGTDRAAKTVAKGVHGVFGGASEIVRGGGNIVIGTLGVVTMPVFGAVGSIVRAFMPERQKPAEKSQ
ncbi:MAG: hypothetical protein HQL96_10925 [Magnetococcales bacterium]|nr:hypothetical protein [Magnetococcales bacterium]